MRIVRSLQDVLAETAWVATVAVALGLLAFASLRAVPLRLLRQALERAPHLATHDPLTGLPNRALLREHLGRALAEARGGGGTVAALIVAAVVGLGQSLGLPTVAEGVEDAAAAGLLAGLGCNVGQGWLFGRAVPEGDAAALAAGMAIDPGRPARAEEALAG